MIPSELNLRALSVRDLIEKGVGAASAIWPNTQVRWEVQSNIGNFNFLVMTNEDFASQREIAALVSVAEKNEFLICSQLQITRESNNQREGFRYHSDRGFLAAIQIQHNPEPARAIAIVECLKSHFDFLPLDDLTKKMMEPPEVAALQLREAAVADLHAQLSKLTTLIATLPERDLELRAKRLADLDAEHQARISTFERERAAALERDEAERKLKLDELAGKESVLTKRVAEFETRESKFVRRDLLEKLSKLLDDFGKFKLSDETAEKRRPVSWTVWFTGSIFLTLGLASGGTYFWTRDLHYLPASISGLLGFSAAMLYYIKWSDTWFREHADEEFKSKRYKADMLRASWIAELAAEWVKEGKDAPPELLAVFARNLFTNNIGVPEVEHPADALLGMMKRLTKVDLAKDRVTVEAGPAAVAEPPK